ncbi:Flagellar motor rotation protein MotB [Marinobacterium lacunae]|uniref:Flagellar motor rotation protein MotB n=1 Tax=Marinobacterium lacunae TaxID=1232683 RepID=A0A081G0H5_9GAMM|nr:flagellar motor protein MotB [Marinobacterium lacunae]KEA64280.1 Flagellar motor rotation protein MotB [Marinobacterium lacunae]MBR9882926.1 flagellar motor protein MotD [Oceanospirillales bacterium]
MPRRRPPEPDAPLDRWVLSWADFLTLLFAFFVVMYAISSVNEEKYRSMSEALSQVFSGPGAPKGANRALDGGSGLLEGGETDKKSSANLVGPANEGATLLLNQVRAQLESDFSEQSASGEIEVSGSDLWFSIELRSNLLFASGGAIPSIEADSILARIAERLEGLDNPIHVEGFTDNAPISTDQFPSNWELSAARAAAVVRLLEMNGINPARMAAVGYGEYQPAYSNRTEEGRRLNRRIVIVVSRDEKVRRAVVSYGSEQVSSDAVSTMLTDDQDSEAAPGAMEQVETEDGILFRQANPEQ